MVESNGATRYEHVGAAGSVPSRERTIVARGQLDGVRCVDMLIDTGASCCFIRRSCAERLKLAADTAERAGYPSRWRTGGLTVVTHEVRVASMNVHGSKAACALLLLDELSNDVIVGMDWIRQTGLSIRGGVQYDMLNGQPVRSSRVTLAVVEDEWPVDRPVRLSAALLNAASVSAVRRSCESLRATGLDVASMGNSQLRQVLYRHRHVFTEVLPVKTAEQIAQARQFSIVLVGDEVRPVKQRERRPVASGDSRCHPVGAGRSGRRPNGTQHGRVGRTAGDCAEAQREGTGVGLAYMRRLPRPERSDEGRRRAVAADGQRVRSSWPVCCSSVSST